jgi:hypothetical protein
MLILQLKSRGSNVVFTFKGYQMALTPQALVGITAGILKLPISTVRNFDRKLMEAGLRTKKGHGRGSAIMTPSDAGTLLLALAASDEIGRVVGCVKSARELPILCTPEVPNERHSTDQNISMLAGIIGCEPIVFATFGSAIDSVMSYLALNSVQEHLFTFSVDSVGGHPLAAELYVTHTTNDNFRSLRYRRQSTADEYLANALRVVRFVPGTVVSHIAGQVGFSSKRGGTR